MSVVPGHVVANGAIEGLESITVRSADGSTEAEFVPSANMVCCSLRYRGVEFLYQRSGVAAYAEGGAPMGIPLLHPWANRLAGFEYRAAGKHVVLPKGEGVIPVDKAGLPDSRRACGAAALESGAVAA